jgi:SAM-dependent methyltransferase
MTLERLEAWGREDWVGDIVRAARARNDRVVRVLEAGCGTGQYSLALALKGYEVDALDYNPAALERARELIATVGARGRAPSLLQGDLLRLPNATDTYDLVFNQQVMEYFVDPDERQAALAQMVRTTKPGGVVVVVVARPGHLLAPIWRRFGWPGFIDQPAMADLTPRELEDELRRSGLVDVASDGIAPWRALFFWPRWYERWPVTRRAIGALTRLLEHVPLPCSARRWLGLQLLVVGRKPTPSGAEPRPVPRKEASW